MIEIVLICIIFHASAKSTCQRLNFGIIPANQAGSGYAPAQVNQVFRQVHQDHGGEDKNENSFP